MSVDKQISTQPSGQLLPSMSDGSNQTNGLPVVWLPPPLIDGDTVQLRCSSLFTRVERLKLFFHLLP